MEYHIVLCEDENLSIGTSDIKKRFDTFLTAKKLLDSVHVTTAKFDLKGFKNAVYFEDEEIVYFNIEPKDSMQIIQQHVLQKEPVESLKSHDEQVNHVFFLNYQTYLASKSTLPSFPIFDVAFFVANNEYKALGNVLKALRPVHIHAVNDQEILKGLSYQTIKAVELTPELKKKMAIEESDSLEFETLQSFIDAVSETQATVVTQATSLVDTMRIYLEYVASETCGKCTPCREGSKRILDYVNKLYGYGATHQDFEKMIHLATVMNKASLCPFGPNSSAVMLSVFSHFKADFYEYIDSYFNRKYEKESFVIQAKDWRKTV